MSDAMKVLDDYLDAKWAEGEVRISHTNGGEDCGYSYWYDESYSSLCWKVDASEVFELREAVLSEDGKSVEFDGVVLAIDTDYRKLRRRVEDRLRKSNNKTVFEVAVKLDVDLYTR